MQDTIIKIESNIDDASGEMLGYVMDLLFDAGASDVYYTPIYMKKNRPAWQLNVLCKEEKVPIMEEIIIWNTTTIGVRRCEMQRSICEREFQRVQTEYGAATVKVCSYAGREKAYPEYEDVISLCKQSGKSYSEIYQLVVATYHYMKEVRNNE